MRTKAEASNAPAQAARAPRLVELLRQLPERELSGLVQRLRIRIDSSKRIDIASQVGRVLLSVAELRDPGRLPAPSRELLFRLAESQGVLQFPALPQAAQALVARGLVFVGTANGGAAVELLLPIAYLLQLPAWEGEDPRGVRALLSQVSANVASSIASHYLGRPATPPVALSLETAWETLINVAAVEREVVALAPVERRLLAAIEEVGGEVDTEELLDLEREPMRLRGASGATLSRRGVGFALERRGFLVPVHPNRHVIPTQVAAVVGAQRRLEREAQRREIRLFILEEDHEPRRARFASDPAELALAMAIAVREPGVDVRAGVGTPRSLITRLATRFGQEPDTVAIVAALSRAIGLWDVAAAQVACQPGSHQLHQLGKALFDAWRRGGAWDEARADADVLRVPVELREASVVGVVRDIVLEALGELGDGRWAPWEAIAAYVRADSRAPGITRLIERWAARAGLEPLAPAEIARTIAVSSLHALGVVDLGDPDSEDNETPGPTVRLTPRGRAYLADTLPAERAERTAFVDNQLLRIGGDVAVGDVLALAPFVEIAAVAGCLDLTLSARTVSQAIGAGMEARAIEARLSAVVELPDAVTRLLAQASAVLGRVDYVETHGFIWIEDPELRELLRARRQTADLFVDPSPPGGLLLAPGVDLERLARRCRGLGVEVLVDGNVHVTRSMVPSQTFTLPASDTESPSSGLRDAQSSGPRPRRSSVVAPTSQRTGSRN